MTLQQLKYVLAVADKGSINEAAKSLFISQPSLSNAIKELEQELHITIFVRTNRGMTLTNDGYEFIGYARQVIQQYEILEEKYIEDKYAKQHFCVSTQHYGFAANAFISLIQQYGGDKYEFSIKETKTFEIIEDVKNLRSEIGIIYLSNYNKSVLQKIIRESNLKFLSLIKAKPHIFISENHPLANKKLVSLDDLDEYPYLSFEQGTYNSFYFSEEILSTRSVKKSIKISDRAAIFDFMVGLNGYTISSGMYPAYFLNGRKIISIPLDVDEVINIGVIYHKDITLSNLGQLYLQMLKDLLYK
ncbi:LysR family transcriptional regulator [Intestinibacter sp.]|uniref:LysR family transcriptional regulator n=1 Tax=Intestinibacter sp. TaxID=1965304 RepID=UPI002A91C5D3|nr:LysR family transcriptional regulator [Intestinibacter sp.]MDY5213443.1 LysR family transcriptional regulator [Intestinibacter sp.]